jgi:hypothetical protein
LRFSHLSLCLFMLAATLWGADPFVGTWKINLQKSTGPGVPKEEVATISEDGDNLRVSLKGINRNGNPFSTVFLSPKAGGPVKYLEGNPGQAVFRTEERVDASTRKRYTKVEGKLINTTTMHVSPDGNTYTVQQQGSNRQGDKIDALAVYDRQ